jgi:tRNA(Ile)-lysidine synthase TilS/MesJ
VDKKEEERHIFKVTQKVKKAIFDFGLIEDNDKIIIGLSGGKDSLAMTEILAAQQRIFRPRFSLVAVHINLTNVPYESDIDYLRGFVSNTMLVLRK